MNCRFGRLGDEVGFYKHGPFPVAKQIGCQYLAPGGRVHAIERMLDSR
jgi:hypothetical protein